MSAPPIPLSSFVGREAELELGRDLLSRSRLVTITGPGGAGKTRLALELVRTGAIAFCDLAPASDGETAQAAVANALGLEAGAGGTGRERIARRLQRETGVLVMDNCEHVIDAAAEIAESMLVSAPEVRLLATSQEPLAIPGENLLRLGALSADDARRLFVERVQEGDARFDPGAAGEHLIAVVCSRLDGIPLALELAAARARTMPLSDLANGLEDRFALLRTASRRAPTRQQTLEAAVAWSYGLLGDEERIMFDRVAVLPGRFPLEAAAAVTAGAIGARDVGLLLSRLGERSLLETSGDRYRMPETLRAFGRDRLREAGDLADVLVLATRWYDSVGFYRTGVGVTQAALGELPPADERRADLLDLAASQAERAANYEFEALVLGELRDLETVTKDPARLANVEMRLASANSMATGDLTLSLPPAEHALSLYRELGDEAMALQAEVELAWLDGMAGQIDTQWERGSAVAARAAETAPESLAYLHALGCAATAAAFTGRFGESRRMLEEGLSLARRRNETYQRGWFSGILGQLLVFTEGPRPALKLVGETRDEFQESLDPVYVEAEVHALLLAGDPAGLVELARSQESLVISFGLRGGFIMSAAAAGAAMAGQAALARQRLASAHRLFGGTDIYYQRLAHGWMEGLVDWSLGAGSEAARLMLESGAAIFGRRSVTVAAFALRDAIDAAWDAGDQRLEAEAQARFDEVVALLDSDVYRALEALGTPAGTEALARLGCRGLHARSLEREGRYEEAAAAYAELGMLRREDRALHRLALAGKVAASPVARRLSRLVLLDGVPPAELEELAAGAVRFSYAAGDRIFGHDEPAAMLFAIDSGSVRLAGAAGSAEVDAGELAGERAMIPGEPHVVSASAVSPAEALGIEPAALLRLVKGRPALAERLVALVHQRVRQEARLAGEPEPPDVAGRVLGALQDAAVAAGDPLPAFEVLPVYLGAGGPMLLRPDGTVSWLVDAAPGRVPAAVIEAALEAAGCPAEIVHSTSWRFDAARLVLTYLAIMPGASEVPGFEATPVRRAELARGSAKGAPSSIDVGQVVEHGLRHLSWLSRDDPVIREELSPEWLALVADYQPEPFRAL